MTEGRTLKGRVILTWFSILEIDIEKGMYLNPNHSVELVRPKISVGSILLESE